MTLKILVDKGNGTEPITLAELKQALGLSKAPAKSEATDPELEPGAE